MKDWKKVEIGTTVYRQYSRACARKNLKVEKRDRFDIDEVRYQTDGYSTVAVITVSESSWLLPADAKPIIVHGYGVAVRADGDKFNEQYGASIAINRAFEGVATVIKQRLAKREAKAAK